MTQLKGVDISHWQTISDWNAMAKDVDFVYIKATEGSTYVDPKAIDFWNNAKAVHLKAGFYHFATFKTIADGVKQADFFVDTIGDKPVDLPLVLDLEANYANMSPADLTQAAMNFLERVTARTGKPVMVYTYGEFIKNELTFPLSKYPLWYANYGNGVLPNSLWSKYVARQTTDAGTLNGLNGGFDLDLLDDSVLIHPPVPVPKLIGTVTVTADNLHVRADHDINSKIVGLIHKGETYKCYGLRFGWYDLGSGWVSQYYVTFK